jgi:hypothetical protein
LEEGDGAGRPGAAAVFGGLPRWALVRLVEAAREEELPVGRTVLHQHDRTRTVHLLPAGALQIYVRVGDDDLLVTVLGDPGELVGLPTARPPDRATASVGCEQPSRLISCRSRPGPRVLASSSQRRSNACQRRSSGSLSSLVDDVHHLRNCRALDAGPSLPHASGDLVVVQDPPILICRVVDASPTQECLDP